MIHRDEFSQSVRAQVRDLGDGPHRLIAYVEDKPIHYRLKKCGRAKTLVVHFHGAVDRKRFELPKYPSLVRDIDAHQISMPDPTLFQVRKPFRTSWYAGHDGFDTQSLLSEFFATVKDELSVERVIYFGNSSGGFAALLFSQLDPQSIAIVGNPQTKVLSHRADAVENFRRFCWPEAVDATQMATKTALDVCKLYGRGFRNKVVYIQSLGDRQHYTDQMMPFIDAVAGTEDAANLLLHCDFFGGFGHVAPVASYLQWVHAAVTSPSLEVDDLLQSLDAIRGSSPASSSEKKPKKSKSKAKPSCAATNPSDLAIADRLRTWRKQDQDSQGDQA